jgi:TPR repeat protein
MADGVNGQGVPQNYAEAMKWFRRLPIREIRGPSHYSLIVRTVARCGDYSGLMPAALMIGHHFSISAL